MILSLFIGKLFSNYLKRGRGAFETIGSGIAMDYHDIAFKCNFAYMDPITKVVIKRRVDREFDKWGLPLIDVL
jgi:2,3-bisphosphoglycerate-independent phosphoglycerate mutase